MPSITLRVKDRGSDGANSVFTLEMIGPILDAAEALGLDPDEYETPDDKNDHFKPDWDE